MMKGIYLLLACGLSVSALGDASEVLLGVAANISAATPMVMAGIQAAADRDIARTNSQTSIATTQINASTSEFLATLQAQTSMSQIAATLGINAMNQAGTTDRLMAQLRELSAGRRDGLALEREKLHMEFAFSNKQIELAERSAGRTTSLERLTAQLTRSGVTPALSIAASSAKLAVSRVLSSGGGSRVLSSTGSRLNSLNQRVAMRLLESPAEVRGSGPSIRQLTPAPLVKRGISPPKRVLADWGPRVRDSETTHLSPLR